MNQISHETSNKICRYVYNDLNPNIFDIAWRIGGSALTGGLISLFFCGQFGVGFSSMATGCNHLIHGHMGSTKCAIICGMIYSIAPVIFLRILSTRFLFRKIIYQYWKISIAPIIISGFIMCVGGSIMNEYFYASIWAFSACFGFKILSLGIDKISFIETIKGRG